MDKLFFILSILFNIIIIYFFYFKKNLIYIMPLIPFCGRWLFYIFPETNLFVLSYMEFFFGLYFIQTNKLKTNNLIIIFLFFLFLATLIPFVNIISIENLTSHLFFCFLFFTTFFQYTYIVNTLNNTDINKFVNIYSIIWVLLSFVYKVISSFGFEINFLLIRGGSSHYASNHAGYFLITLLPFIKNKKVELMVLITLITFFSRGLILCVISYYIIKLLIYKKNKLLMKLIFFIFFIFLILNMSIFNEYKNFMFLRLIGNTSIANNIDKEDISNIDINLSEINYDAIIDNVLEDDRSNIWNASLNIIMDSNFFGVGFGNFSTVSKIYDSNFEYSNSHNLFLNITAELGLLFFIVFIVLILYLILNSSKELKISIFLFVIYGFFSGQIYEASFEKSMVDFYHLLLLIVIGRLYEYKDYREQKNLI